MNKFYYLDGEVLNHRDFTRTLHRLDGPAVEWGDGSKFWFVNGRYHRLDGPAIEYSNGEQCWLINSKHFTKEEFERHILIMNLSGLING